MTTTPELLPCPFCGNPEPSFERMGTPRQSCIVVCGNCGARHESSDEGERSGSQWSARAALSTHTAQAAEPVAWGFPNTAITGSNRWMMLRESLPPDDQYGGALWVPLYAAPQPATHTAQPLTDEQIIRLAREVLEKPVIDGKPAAFQLAEGIARAIERAHGIGTPAQQAEADQAHNVAAALRRVLAAQRRSNRLAPKGRTMNNTAAGASPVDCQVGRLVPERGDVEALLADPTYYEPRIAKTRLPDCNRGNRCPWSEESGANGWRSTCRHCGLRAQGSGQ